MSSGLVAIPRPLLNLLDQVDIRDYLPAGFVKDGSVNYSSQVSSALSAARTKGAWLVFPKGTWQTSLTLADGDKVKGPGTIKCVPTDSPTRGILGHNNVVLDGLTIDANGATRGAQFSGKSGWTIRNCTFRNTGSDYAIYTSTSVTNAVIEDNTFEATVYGGITLYNPTNVRVRRNTILGTTTTNAISSNIDNSNCTGLIIEQNTIRACNRMGIELFRQATNFMLGTVVDGNYIELVSGSAQMGMSVICARSGRISNNTIRCLGAGASNNGIEVGGQLTQCEGNTVMGFQNGITVNTASGSTIANNLITDNNQDILDLGITIVNALNVTVRGNSITDPKSYGIRCSGGNWYGSTIEHNTIRRARTFASEVANWRGLYCDAAPGGAVTIRGNRIHLDQTTKSMTATSPSSTFFGMHLGGTAAQWTGSIFDNNVILTSLTVTAVGQNGVYVASSPGMGDGTIWRNNVFSNVYAPVWGLEDAATMTAKTVKGSGNVFIGATDTTKVPTAFGTL